MKTLYFDCFAGASGNMILGGLVSLGVDPVTLTSEVKKLNIGEFDILFTEVNRAGINSVHAETLFEESRRHRHLSEIIEIIDKSILTESIKRCSIEMFTNLANAEAGVHGIDVEKVHFHEVGAMDAIIDVVGACIGFEMLGIERFICSRIHTGSGFVEITHGKYPIPPPAVAELLKEVPIYQTEIEGELITPTGAAIITSICTEFGSIPKMEVEQTGYGAGTRNYDRFPNVLRLMFGKSDIGSEAYSSVKDSRTGKEKPILESQKLILIETNLDDVSPEVLGFVMERAMEIGALDCWFTPIQMKKNRPATMVSVLCEREKKEVLSELLFSETTTLGVRINEIERNCLPREFVKIQTEFGEIEVKIARYGKRIVNVKPEYEQLRKIAKKTGYSIRAVEATILKSFEETKEVN